MPANLGLSFCFSCHVLITTFGHAAISTFNQNLTLTQKELLLWQQFFHMLSFHYNIIHFHASASSLSDLNLFTFVMVFFPHLHLM